MQAIAHGRHVDPKEGIGLEFLGEGAGHGRCSAVAHGLGLLVAAPKRRVAGFYHAGKARVVNRVLMSTTHPGGPGKGRQALQRAQHLLGGALEKAAASQAEQGISAEHHAFSGERHMRQGVAGNFQDVEGPVRNVNAVTLADWRVFERNPLVGGAPDRQIRLELPQCSGAADVIVVVVGQQDCDQGPALRSQIVQYRPRFARIDDQDAPLRVRQGPDVVVAEGGQGAQFQRGGLESDTIPNMRAHPPARQTPPLDWFATTAGQGLLAVEHAAMARVLAGTPAMPWCWISVSGAVPPQDARNRGVLLRREGGRFGGDARCALPLPLANESFGAVLLQHALDDAFPLAHRDEAPDADLLLGECERILAPGGVLWMAALNPWSPYRARWARTGLRASVTGVWQTRLRRAGFALESVSLQWLGPRWHMDQGDVGVGMHDWLRAGVAFSVSKRVRALQPPTRLRQLRLHGAALPRVCVTAVAREAVEHADVVA